MPGAKDLRRTSGVRRGTSTRRRWEDPWFLCKWRRKDLNSSNRNPVHRAIAKRKLSIRMRHQRDTERKVLWFRPQEGIPQAACCNLGATDGFCCRTDLRLRWRGSWDLSFFNVLRPLVGISGGPIVTFLRFCYLLRCIWWLASWLAGLLAGSLSVGVCLFPAPIPPEHFLGF
jgi:hypothetical protein